MVVGDEHDSLFICISIPQDVPRFLEVGSRGVRVPVETAVGQSFAFPLLATTLVVNDARLSTPGRLRSTR